MPRPLPVSPIASTRPWSPAPLLQPVKPGAVFQPWGSPAIALQQRLLAPAPSADRRPPLFVRVAGMALASGLLWGLIAVPLVTLV